MPKIIPKVENLVVGQKYTYEELYTTLGESFKSNRESQYNRWKKYFIYEHLGKYFLIKEIKEVADSDGRINGNNSKYIIPFKDIIMHYLSRQNSMVYETNTSWLIKLNILSTNISENYHILKNQYDVIAQNTIVDFNNCKLETTDFIYSKFKSALDSLIKSGNIIKESTYMLVTPNNEYTLATSNEVEELNILFNKTMEELGISSLKNIKLNNKKSKLLYTTMNKKVFKTYGYIKIYKVIGLEKTRKNYLFKYENTKYAQEELAKKINLGLTTHFYNHTPTILDTDIILDEELLNFYDKLLENNTQINVPNDTSTANKENYAKIMMAISEIFLSL